MADQEDICTFIQNAMIGLRLVLDQQALEHEMLQPGVEQFVHGMLHRVKNELNEPANALRRVEEALTERRTEISRESPKLLEVIAGAESTITGIRELFSQWKGFSDDQRAFIPIQKFSTDWIGWVFLTKVCDSAIKEVTRSLVQEPDPPRGSILGEIERIRDLGKNQLLECHADADSVSRLQRALAKLADVLERHLRPPGAQEPVTQFVLTFEVFPPAYFMSAAVITIWRKHQHPDRKRVSSVLELRARRDFQGHWHQAPRCLPQVGLPAE